MIHDQVRIWTKEEEGKTSVMVGGIRVATVMENGNKWVALSPGGMVLSVGPGGINGGICYVQNRLRENP